MTTFDLPDEFRKPYWENRAWIVLMVIYSILRARCWFAVEMCILRSSADKMGVMLRGMFKATRNRVLLSGGPWGIPFCWGCTEECWP